MFVVCGCVHTVNGDEMKELRERLEEALAVDASFDLVRRVLQAQDRAYFFYFIDGFVKDEIMEKMMEFLLERSDADDPSMRQLEKRLFPYVEVELCADVDACVHAVLSGVLALWRQGDDTFVLIDARTYPTRSMSEPEDDRVLRGARDSFVETLVFNTALIRRRLRDPRLRMEYFSVGKTKDDVVLCSIHGVCDPQLHDQLADRLKQLQVESLTMGQESLAEALIPRKLWQIFPLVRYTERPDVASAHVQEGGIALIVDNSPSVLLLPVALLDFVQEAQDYYFPPLIGSYLRFVRILVFFLAQFLTPVWYWLNQNPQRMPQALSFTLIEGSAYLDVFWQLLLLEIGIDAIKLASLNTPSSLSGSFSIIGALILGDFAIKAGWFDAEILLYMAFVALANFTQPSYEMSYAIKLFRMCMLVLIALFPRWGLLVSLVLLALVLKGQGKGYLAPLIPFRPKRLIRLLFRFSIRHSPKSGHHRNI